MEVFTVAKMFLFVTEENPDSNRLEILCKHLVKSLESTSKNLSYVGLVLTKQFAIQWVAHIKALLIVCCRVLEKLSPEFPADMKALLIYLHTLVSFTGTKTWAILNNSKNEVVVAGMNIICNTIVEHLVARGFMSCLKVSLFRARKQSNF